MPHLGKTFFLLSFCAAFGMELTVHTSSKQLYIGEAFVLTYRFEYLPGEAPVDYRFAAPALPHFKVLDRREVTTHQGAATQWDMRYIVLPMQSGELQTGAAAMNLAKRTYKKDAWGEWMNALAWEQQRFESAAVFVNPVPPGIGAVGRFTLNAAVDRNKTDAGNPVRLTLSLRGCGDLETADPLHIELAGVNVFEEGVSPKAVWKNGCYYSERNESFALVSDKDFTIPAVVFSSFDPLQGAVVKTQTLPIDIHVVTAEVRETDATKRGTAAMILWEPGWAAVAGFGFGVAATLWFVRRQKKQRHVRTDPLRTLLKELLGHLDDREAKASAEAVEKYLYEGAEAPDANAIAGVLSRLKKASESREW